MCVEVKLLFPQPNIWVNWPPHNNVTMNGFRSGIIPKWTSKIKRGRLEYPTSHAALVEKAIFKHGNGQLGGSSHES